MKKLLFAALAFAGLTICTTLGAKGDTASENNNQKDEIKFAIVLDGIKFGITQEGIIIDGVLTEDPSMHA